MVGDKTDQVQAFLLPERDTAKNEFVLFTFNKSESEMRKNQ